jgi:hypothetical protein
MRIAEFEIRNSFGKRSHCTEDKTQNLVFRSEGRKDRLLNRGSQSGVPATKLVLVSDLVIPVGDCWTRPTFLSTATKTKILAKRQ